MFRSFCGGGITRIVQLGSLPLALLRLLGFRMPERVLIVDAVDLLTNNFVGSYIAGVMLHRDCLPKIG